MTTPALVALLTGCTAFIAYMLLVGRAFSRHTGWGIAVMLLSPVSATAYGINFWKEEKFSFLAYLVTSSATAGLCLLLFTNWGGWELVKANEQVKQAIVSHTLTSQDVKHLLSLSEQFDRQSGLTTTSSNLLNQAHRELTKQAEKQAAADTVEAETVSRQSRLGYANISRKSQSDKKQYKLAYVTIDVNDATKYVGSTVKVTRKNVVEKEYRLIGASRNRLELTQRAGRGSFKFHYRNRDIEKLRVLTKQPY